jgi:tetratricopeptide (TPR) repeat protein
LAHKELWPYAYQYSEDLQVLTHMAQTTRALNPSVRHGRTCELVRTWLTGKFQEAKGQLELLIQEFPNISFYIWLKTDMLISENDFINGQGFASSLVAIWPEFTRGKILSVQASIGIGRVQEAREKLAQVLRQNPSHKVAKLLLGDIEFRHFQQEEKAWELLVTGMNSPELVPRQINVMAYTTLALLSEKRGDMASARKYAENGFELNPTNEMLRGLVKKFGGSDQNFNEAARTQELVALGDQYVRSGDCLGAQAQYRAAFDLNPQHPVAAVKAARCLYKINQIFQAFEYLKRAIKANPEYFPAYTLLADYYSQKFDFNSAMGVLNQARAYSTEAYEIYKGYALVELRKNNFVGSMGYITRAISIYSTDPEAYVIMSKAQLGAGQAKESFQAAQKAIEIDAINVDAHIAYGQSLAVLQGENTGIEYLRKLVIENKYVIEYKMALAALLTELERFSEALPLYEEVVAIDTKNKKAQMGLGESLSGIGKVEAALSAYLLAATFDPTDPEPVVMAGLLYMDTSRLDPAIQQFERALVINKNYPKAYYYIGKAAFMKGDLQKALDSALSERRANPNIVESYLLAAEIYMVTRKYTQCTTEYQEAIKIRPQGGDNYVKLARCYRLSGSYDVAQSMLDIAAEKESGYAEIYKERGALYQAQGEKETALKAYEKYLALSPNAVDKKTIEDLMSQLTVR